MYPKICQCQLNHHSKADSLPPMIHKAGTWSSYYVLHVVGYASVPTPHLNLKCGRFRSPMQYVHLLSDSPNPDLTLLSYKPGPSYRHFHNRGSVQYSMVLLQGPGALLRGAISSQI